MPQNMTHVGVASGKTDKEFEGSLTAVYDKWTLNDYDPDSDGTGNDFDPSYYGIDRLVKFDVQVVDGQAYDAEYDEDDEVIRLYSRDGTGEVGNNTTVDVDLKIEVRGN